MPAKTIETSPESFTYRQAADALRPFPRVELVQDGRPRVGPSYALVGALSLASEGASFDFRPWRRGNVCSDGRIAFGFTDDYLRTVWVLPLED